MKDLRNKTDSNIEIISLRERPEHTGRAIKYIQSKWASEDSMNVYEDIAVSIAGDSPLPQWYIICAGESIIGCAGLITNDFISRMDLYPWICALYIDEAFRGRALGSALIDKACADAKTAGFASIYLCTDLIGYYEKYGFAYLGDGHHPWGESSRIYGKKI